MEIALKFRGDLELSFQKGKEDRKILIELLNQINFISEVYRSSGSFVTFRVDNQNISKNLRSFLITKHNIYLKQLTNEGLGKSNYFRVALVSLPEIEKLIKALKGYSTSNSI